MNTFESSFNPIGVLGFSGCDIKAVINAPRYPWMNGVGSLPGVYVLGTLQTISLSTFASKIPCKTLGYKSPRKVARGHRTFAGTLIFNQLHTHVLNNRSEYNVRGNAFQGSSLGAATTSTSGYIDTATGSDNSSPGRPRHQWDYSRDVLDPDQFMLPSDLPPFDIMITMVNEMGNIGRIQIKGVELTQDSQVLSVEDIYTEQQYQYIATDIIPYRGDFQ